MRHLGFEVRRLEKLITRKQVYSSVHAEADRLTGMHGYLIGYLYHNQDHDVFQKDIERQFSLSRSAVTATLQLMEKNGLIIRESVEQDARLKRIILTQKSLDLHQQIQDDILSFESLLTEGVTDEEAEIFLRVIRKMCRNLGETEDPQIWRYPGDIEEKNTTKREEDTCT